MDLKAWRKSKGWTQGAVAEKIGAVQGTYGAYETGRISIPAAVQAKIRKLGYTGAWPSDEQKEPAAPAADQLTRDDFFKAIGGLEAKIRDLEGVIEDLGAGLAAAIPSMPPRFRRGARTE